MVFSTNSAKTVGHPWPRWKKEERKKKEGGIKEGTNEWRKEEAIPVKLIPDRRINSKWSININAKHITMKLRKVTGENLKGLGKEF